MNISNTSSITPANDAITPVTNNAATINFQPTKKALASLQRALQQPIDEYMRDTVIQRFEYTYELMWKVLKRHLIAENNIREPLSVKQLYREAAHAGLIDDVATWFAYHDARNLTSWFAYHDARNLTSHTYNEDTAAETYKAAQSFAIAATQLLAKLEEKSIALNNNFASNNANNNTHNNVNVNDSKENHDNTDA